MLFDKGYYEPLFDFDKGFKNGSIKFKLMGKRLKGIWSLVHFKDDNWLLIKEKDGTLGFRDINIIKTSIKSGRTMEQIAQNIKRKQESNENIIENVEITNPEKIIYKSAKITKLDVIKYYQAVSKKMMPYLENRIISCVRCPDGVEGHCFFKKHLEKENEGLSKISLKNKNGEKEDYFYITSTIGLINEAQMNTLEFHTWASTVDSLNKPDIMVFDLDPDENLSLRKLRKGVKDLKNILDKLKLKSFLKTSGGKGYHVVVPIKDVTSQEFSKIAKDIAVLMETKWPDKYTSNIRKEKRKGKIFIDWQRNTKGATSIAPYSLRARKKACVSMPISWDEIDKVKPNEITIKTALERLKNKDPWHDFFKYN